MSTGRETEADLAELWGKFTLTEVEQDGLEAVEEEVDGISNQGSHCLVGKLISERLIGKDAIRKNMVRNWRLTGSVVFKVLGENLFLLEFELEWDKIRVMEGRPWFFEQQLFSVVDYDGTTPPCKMIFQSAPFWIRMLHLPLSCMGKEMGKKLGETVGTVEEVETNEDGIGWGAYLRVKAHVNFSKPLPRGRILKLKNKSLWIEFQYEKIPRFCFKCGVIRHGAGGCVNEVLRWKNGRGNENEYGPWLRAGYQRRQLQTKGRYGEEEDMFTSETRGRPEFRPTRTEFPDGNGGFFQKEPTGNQEDFSGSSASKINADTEKLMNEDMEQIMKADFQEGKSSHSRCIKGREILGGGVLAAGQSNHENIGVGGDFSADFEETAAANINGKETVMEANFQEGKSAHSRSIKLSEISGEGVQTAGNMNGKELVLEADFQEGKLSHSRSIKLSEISGVGVLAVDKSTHENMGVGGEFSAELEESVTESPGNLINGKSSGSKKSAQVTSGNLSRGQERVMLNQTKSKLMWKKRARGESFSSTNRHHVTDLDPSKEEVLADYGLVGKSRQKRGKWVETGNHNEDRAAVAGSQPRREP
jgi:hypothetical protein